MTIPLSGATYANVTARFSSWSLDVHIRIRGEAINLVVPKSLARSRLMPRTTRRLIHSSYESERPRAHDVQNAFFLSHQVPVDGSKVTEHRGGIAFHARNGSRGTQKSARCVQEAERSMDFLLVHDDTHDVRQPTAPRHTSETNFLIASRASSLNSSD